MSNLQTMCLNRCSTLPPKEIYYAEIQAPTKLHLQKFNSEQKKFEKFATTMNISRRDFSWILHGNKLYIMGGKDIKGEPCDDVSTCSYVRLEDHK